MYALPAALSSNTVMSRDMYSLPAASFGRNEPFHSYGPSTVGETATAARASAYQASASLCIHITNCLVFSL